MTSNYFIFFILKIFWRENFNIFFIFQALKLSIRSSYIIFKCALLFEEIFYLFSSFNAITISYYLDLVHDLLADTVDLFHYAHMLVSLSMNIFSIKFSIKFNIFRDFVIFVFLDLFSNCSKYGMYYSYDANTLFL